MLKLGFAKHCTFDHFLVILVNFEEILRKVGFFNFCHPLPTKIIEGGHFETVFDMFFGGFWVGFKLDIFNGWLFL